jgi:hypothetical protein
LSHPQECEADLEDLEQKWAELERGGNPPAEDLQKRIAEARRQLSIEQT